MTDSDAAFIAWRLDRDAQESTMLGRDEVLAIRRAARGGPLADIDVDPPTEPEPVGHPRARVAPSARAELMSAAYVAAAWVRDSRPLADYEIAQALTRLGQHVLGVELFEAAVRGEGDSGE